MVRTTRSYYYAALQCISLFYFLNSTYLALVDDRYCFVDVLNKIIPRIFPVVSKSIFDGVKVEIKAF